MFEHKITVSNLKRLIFGKGDKKPLDNTSTESIKTENSQRLDNNEFDTSSEESPTPKGHGRLPHTVYSEAKEHHIELQGLTAGQVQ